jgi:hypothetical protein
MATRPTSRLVPTAARCPDRPPGKMEGEPRGRRSNRWAGGWPSGRLDQTPEQILKRGDARGEIERDEYQRRLEDLRRL